MHKILSQKGKALQHAVVPYSHYLTHTSKCTVVQLCTHTFGISKQQNPILMTSKFFKVTCLINHVEEIVL